MYLPEKWWQAHVSLEPLILFSDFVFAPYWMEFISPASQDALDKAP